MQPMQKYNKLGFHAHRNGHESSEHYSENAASQVMVAEVSKYKPVQMS